MKKFMNTMLKVFVVMVLLTSIYVAACLLAIGIFFCELMDDCGIMDYVVAYHYNNGNIIRGRY